jgi:hypothetical protein
MGPALIERGEYKAISRSLEEELFASAQVLSEGGCRIGADGNDNYFGSTMITFDLGRVHRYWRGPFDDKARERFVDAIQGSVRIHLRAMRLAYAEVARRVSDKPIGTALIETRMRLSGEYLYLDIDLEVPVGVSAVLRTP